MAQYRFDHWTADNGLPQNSVYGIVQTQDGYLWLATFDGLARFDGARFTIFNKSNSPGIVNNRFTSLFETASGDLWAGTEESGAGRFRVGRFEQSRKPNSAAARRPPSNGQFDTAPLPPSGKSKDTNTVIIFSINQSQILTSQRKIKFQAERIQI